MHGRRCKNFVTACTISLLIACPLALAATARGSGSDYTTRTWIAHKHYSSEKQALQTAERLIETKLPVYDSVSYGKIHVTGAKACSTTHMDIFGFRYEGTLCVKPSGKTYKLVLRTRLV